MIIGIGNDIVEVARIAKIAQTGVIWQKFIKKILNDEEIKLLPKNKEVTYCAKRFAMKESISKALGCGFGSKLRFVDLTINKDEYGKPYVSISPQSLAKLNLGKIKVHVSVSDDGKYATAMAVVEEDHGI